FPDSEIAVLARPWVADLYARETAIDRVISYDAAPGFRDFASKWKIAAALRAERFDMAVLLQNAFEAAAIARLGRIPRVIGYDRDARRWLLTQPVPVPKRGEIPRHERFYYLELLRRAGLLKELPAEDAIRLEGAAEAAAEGARELFRRGITGPVIGVSPGAAYGNAKRWLPERFAEAAERVAQSEQAAVALFGSRSERDLCDSVAKLIAVPVHNLAGETTLRQFIDMAAACVIFLTNDSGGMHIASALGVPTVAIFGATDDIATGPTGSQARVVREPVECSPCLLRDCPIDHRCMTRIEASRVARICLDLLAK
ncbi:MAG: lipopolysaccharide heptosyltransferase II, partial [Acidobacteriota bacterium]|nr:lipopolysaccharide heptosyltransferase II [Acidobacteriota bacterium]